MHLSIKMHVVFYGAERGANRTARLFAQVRLSAGLGCILKWLPFFNSGYLFALAGFYSFKNRIFRPIL